jgi:uncharacterized protein YjbI with pentapeptide repeats
MSFSLTEYYNQSFHKIETTDTQLSHGYFKDCQFNQCQLVEQDFSHSTFVNCVFNACQISLCQLEQTAFQSVQFKDCQLLGLRFEHCNPFQLSIQASSSQFIMCSFYKKPINKAVFEQCQIQECDFSEAQLKQAPFTESRLSGSTFMRTDLSEANFSSAYDFLIDPSQNKLKKAKFSRHGLEGLLQHFGLIIE